MQPLRATFPIVTTDRDLRYGRRFLGTGFFVASDGTFLTAKHNVDGIELKDDERLAGVIIPHDLAVYPIVDMHASEDYDIAIARLDGIANIEALEVATESPPLNRDVLTVEFSGTASERLDDGTLVMRFNPYYRKGNVVADYTSQFPEKVPTESLDLSFPALRGASGAPVIVEWSFKVVGMVIANVERHLLPAQIETIHHGEGEAEAVRYFLPLGKAIKWTHLRSFVESSQAGPRPASSSR